MAAEAIRDCLGAAGLALADVDMLCTGTSGGDATLPGFANMVQGELAAPPMATSSHSGVCAAGLAAPQHAAMALDGGWALGAVVATSEVPSRLFKRSRLASRGYDIDFDAHFLRWMLSDAAGAWLLEPVPRAALSLRLLGVHLRSFGGDYPVCMQVGLAAGSRRSYLDYESFAAAEADGAYALRQNVRLLPNLFDVGVHEYVRLVRAGWIEPAQAAPEPVGALDASAQPSAAPPPGLWAAPSLDGPAAATDPLLRRLLVELADVWHEYRTQAWRTPIVARVVQGRLTRADLLRWMEDWIPQVQQGSVWMRKAVARLDDRYATLRELVAVHAGEEQYDFRIRTPRCR